MPGGTLECLADGFAGRTSSIFGSLNQSKPSGKLSVLQSREVREEREDERKRTSFAVGILKEAETYPNLFFKHLDLSDYFFFKAQDFIFQSKNSENKKQADVVVKSRHLIL